MGRRIYRFVRDYALIGAAIFVVSPLPQSVEFREEVRFQMHFAKRSAKTAYTCMYIAGDYYMTGEADKAALEACHERSAQRLSGMLLSNGGLFVKIGQLIGEMAHMVPSAYARAMEPMFDQACVSPLEDIESVFAGEFATRPDAIFDSFSTEPLASASLAQVHIARRGGEKLAVKLHHREVSRNAFSDMQMLRAIHTIAKRVLPPSRVPPEWTLQLVADSLTHELNFLLEAEHCRKAEKLNSDMADETRFPRVDSELSALSVLTMGYEEGVPMSDREAMVAAGVDPTAVSRIVSRIFLQMMFCNGFVHCDPHPGNLLVTWQDGGAQSDRAQSEGRGISGGSPGRPSRAPRGLKVVVLDHALYRQFAPSYRRSMRDLWDAVLMGDKNKMMSAGKAVIVEGGGASNPSQDRIRRVVELITATKWADLTALQHPNRRLALLEGAGGDVKRDGVGLDSSLSGFTESLRAVLGDANGEPGDLFFTLKTLACLRASNRAIGVKPNVAMSGGRRALARAGGVRSHWLARAFLTVGKPWSGAWSAAFGTTWETTVSACALRAGIWWIYARMWIAYVRGWLGTRNSQSAMPSSLVEIAPALPAA